MEKKKKIKNGIGLIILFIVVTFLVKLINDLSWILSISCGLVTSILGYFVIKYNLIRTIDKEEEKSQKEFVKTLTTPILKQAIQHQRDFINVAEREYDKRKDKSLKNKIGNELWYILEASIGIVILGIIMFGGLYSMFGVNNEFTNPTNQTNISLGGLNSSNSIELVGNVGEYVLIKMMDIGKGRPSLWFWLFWIGVLGFIILPIIRIIYYIIKYIMKGGKKKDGI